MTIIYPIILELEALNFRGLGDNPDIEDDIIQIRRLWQQLLSLFW